jgi:nucleotide-binding universal stress UspA family protein
MGVSVRNRLHIIGRGMTVGLLVLSLGSLFVLRVIADEPTPPPPATQPPAGAVLHPLGIGLAVVFVVLMTVLFRWMFRVPPSLSPVAVRARQSVSALQRILVPLPERFGYERAVELACRLGAAQKAEIILAHVVEVPLTTSLDAPMPAEQARGEEILSTACSIVRRYGLPVRIQVIADRSASSGILRLAQNEAVDAIVMSVGQAGGSDGIGRTAHELLRHAECEVVLDRAGQM